MSKNDIHNYDDIIAMKRPVSQKHARMSMKNRAAQFAPFAALTGHKEAVDETGRLTEERRILDDNIKSIINYKLQEIYEKIDECPSVKVTYFVEDGKKKGGSYIDYEGNIIKIDVYTRELVFVEGKKISIEDIYSIEH